MLIDKLHIRVLIHHIVFTIGINVDVVAPDDQLYVCLIIIITIDIDAYVVLAEPLMELHILKIYPVLELVIKGSG